VVAAEGYWEREKSIRCKHTACGLFARGDSPHQSAFHQVSRPDWTSYGIATGMKSVTCKVLAAASANSYHG
jgi:hypothetical protein